MAIPFDEPSREALQNSPSIDGGSMIHQIFKSTEMYDITKGKIVHGRYVPLTSGVGVVRIICPICESRAGWHCQGTIPFGSCLGSDEPQYHPIRAPSASERDQSGVSMKRRRMGHLTTCESRAGWHCQGTIPFGSCLGSDEPQYHPIRAPSASERVQRSTDLPQLKRPTGNGKFEHHPTLSSCTPNRGQARIRVDALQKGL